MMLRRCNGKFPAILLAIYQHNDVERSCHLRVACPTVRKRQTSADSVRAETRG